MAIKLRKIQRDLQASTKTYHSNSSPIAYSNIEYQLEQLNDLADAVEEIQHRYHAELWDLMIQEADENDD